jgi:hypothetical protein
MTMADKRTAGSEFFFKYWNQRIAGLCYFKHPKDWQFSMKGLAKLKKCGFLGGSFIIMVFIIVKHL